MNYSTLKSGEYVDVKELLETDIFQLLMKRDRVQPNEFSQLCHLKKQELGRYHSSSASR